MKNLTYRKCGLRDLEMLITISRHTFIEAYEKDNIPEDFKTYINSAFDTKTMKLELENPNSEFYLIYVENVLAGYFKLNQDEAQRESYGRHALELARIYILKEFQGQKIGSASLKEIIALANKKGKSWLWLSVWKLNINAVRFYERHGFTIFDTQDFYVGNDRQIDWLMRIDLN